MKKRKKKKPKFNNGLDNSRSIMLQNNLTISGLHQTVQFFDHWPSLFREREKKEKERKDLLTFKILPLAPPPTKNKNKNKNK